MDIEKNLLGLEHNLKHAGDIVNAQRNVAHVFRILTALAENQRIICMPTDMGGGTVRQIELPHPFDYTEETKNFSKPKDQKIIFTGEQSDEAKRINEVKEYFPEINEPETISVEQITAGAFHLQATHNSASAEHTAIKIYQSMRRLEP